MSIAIPFRVSEAKSSSPVVFANRGGIGIIGQFADEWRRLCDVAADDQPFFRPEWIGAYLRAFVPGAKVVIVTARINGRLCLLLPLVEETSTFNKIPVRRLRAPVNSCCGRFDAVRVAGADGDVAIQATWQYLKKLEGWDVLQFRDIPEESTISQLVAAARGDGFRTLLIPDKPNPYVHVPANSELQKLMPPNSKLRSQLRQARRRLGEQGQLVFSRVETADRQSLERFYQLEASGWKGRIGSCALSDGSKSFYDEVAELAAHFGYLSLYLLELNGELLAAHFSFTHRGRCYSPKVAYNEDFKQFAPGHLIVSEILQDCMTRGIYGYDITGQDQPWKMKWTSEVRGINHHFVFKGPLGVLAHAVGSRLKPAVARLLPIKRKVNESKGTKLPAGSDEES